MGISTKVAKRIWRTRSTVYPGSETTWGTKGIVVLSESEPRYIIVVDHGWMDDPTLRPTVITVAFRSDVPYVREGKTFRPRPPVEAAAPR